MIGKLSGAVRLHQVLLYLNKKTNYETPNHFILLIANYFSFSAYAQNTFPSTGNVGIGVSVPASQFHNKGQALFGVTRTAVGSSPSVINLGANEFINFGFSANYPTGDYHRIGKWYTNDIYALQYISIGADRPTDKAHGLKQVMMMRQ